MDLLSPDSSPQLSVADHYLETLDLQYEDETD